MKWPQFFTRRHTASPQDTSAHLDVRLLKQVKRHTLPRWRQLQYIKKFLTSTELRLITGLVALSALMAVVMIGGFISRHLMTVPAAGGTFSEGMIGQPKYINPIFSSINDVDADLVSLVYTGLFRFNSGGALEPYLADGYTSSTDAKSYSVHLRPGVKWSDGEPVTADDVLFTFEMIQNTEAGSPLYATFQGVKVEKTDDETISFTLKAPFAPFLQSLTVGILPAHIWSDYPASSLRLAKANLQPVGTGPWQFSKLAKDQGGTIQSYTLVPNKYYFYDKPFIQTLQFQFFNDYPPAIDALRNGQIQAISFLPHDSQSKLSNHSFTQYPLLLPQYTALFFNQTQVPTLKDSDVRLALAESIDKSSLIAGALSGEGEVVDGPLPPGSIGYTTEAKKIGFDPSSAVETLDKNWSRLSPEDYFKTRHDSLLSDYQASIPTTTTDATSSLIATSTLESQISDTIRQEMNGDQPYYRQDKNGTILHLTITTVDTPEYVRVANAIASAWRKIGIITGVQVVNSHQINRTVLHDRSFQVLLYGEIVGLDPDLFAFWHSSQISYPGLNLSGFADRASDNLLEDARSTIDPAARATLYQKFQDGLTDELPAFFLYRPRYSFAASNDVHGITFGTLNTASDRYQTLESWYLKTKWEWK